jgi:hypothetical protein
MLIIIDFGVFHYLSTSADGTHYHRDTVIQYQLKSAVPMETKVGV